MAVRPATLDDIPFIDALRAKEWESVGFIPKTRYEMEVEGERSGTILVVSENGEPCGFVYATHSHTMTSVTQLAVAQDARRIERGKALVTAIQDVADRKGHYGLRCRVAADLEANAFWQAIGFDQVGEGMGRFLWKPAGPKSRLVRVYERLTVPRLL